MFEFRSMSRRVASICACIAASWIVVTTTFGRQRRIGRDHLIARRVFLRLHRLHRPSGFAAEYIRHMQKRSTAV